MPATLPTAGDREYFRTWAPAAAALEACLAIFATIIILRSCLRFVCSKFRQSNESQFDFNVSTSQRDFNLSHFRNPLRHSQAQQQNPLRQPYWDMEKDSGSTSPDAGEDKLRLASLGENAIGSMIRQPLAWDSRWSAGNNHGLRNLISRPPPAPPLTPPELSSTIFTLEARPEIQDSFIHQPNPDYSSTSTSSSGSQPSTLGTTSYPRKLSYNKTVPIGIPVSRQSSQSDTDLTFTANSYPPTSPVLPPPPSFPEILGDGSPEEGKIGLQGQIVTMLDHEGAGWTRHTRVYGGGVCLACAAAGREHGEGGYYGDTVSPEEKR